MKEVIRIVALIALLSAQTFADEAPRPHGPVPTKAQLAWHEVEVYGLVCFNIQPSLTKNGRLETNRHRCLIQHISVPTRL